MPRLLLVEDDPLTLGSLRLLLEPTGAELHFASNGEEALREVARRQFAAVLLDVGLPGIDGYEVARHIKAVPSLQHLPLIFLTGRIDDREVRRGYEAGAIDYLLKPIDPDVLQAKLRAFLELARLREEAAALTHRALHDPLTGLPNRTLFLDRLDQALSRLYREPGQVGVLFVDLDDFKQTNDLLGHDHGDRLLVAAATRLQAAIRAVDTAARFGGDEFLVLCERLDEPTDLARVAQRVTDHLMANPDAGANPATRGIRASVGYASTDDPTTPPEDLIRAADQEMLRVKTTQRLNSR